MNEIQLWYFDSCERELNYISRLRHAFSETYKHKGKKGIVVKEHEIVKPEIDEICHLSSN